MPRIEGVMVTHVHSAANWAEHFATALTGNVPFDPEWPTLDVSGAETPDTPTHCVQRDVFILRKHAGFLAMHCVQPNLVPLVKEKLSIHFLDAVTAARVDDTPDTFFERLSKTFPRVLLSRARPRPFADKARVVHLITWRVLPNSDAFIGVIFVNVEASVAQRILDVKVVVCQCGCTLIIPTI